MDEKFNESDRCLIEACIQKDIAAWSCLVKKYSSLVCISIENRLKKYNLSASRHDIEDIRQDVFADIWKNNKLAAITNREDISYWIAIVSGNAAVEHFRTGSMRQAQRCVSLFERIGEKELSEFLPSKTAGPKDELARSELEARVDEIIETLSGKEKIMIKLQLIHDKKYHEIAGMLGVPKGTVSSYIKRAKEKLREGLKNY